MKWSYRLVRIAGIDINIHTSFVLLIIYVLAMFGSSGLFGIVTGSLFTLALFFCVTLHELGHALVARYFGISVDSILLWPLGGLTMMSRMPEKPLHEVLIMAAGPLVNLVLALAAFVGLVPLVLFGYLMGFYGPAPLVPTPVAISFMLTALIAMGVINLMLGLFNLLPAFPLDGGRILHAVLGMLIGPQRAGLVLIGLSWPIALGLGIGALLLGDLLLGIVAVMLFLTSGLLNSRITGVINRGFTQLHAAFCYVTNRGNFYLLRGDYARALAWYDRVVQRNPEQAEGYLHRGMACFYQQEYDRALADVERAIQLQPEHGDAYRIRGLICYVQSEDAQALADYALALHLQPNDALACNNQGCVYHLQGDYQQALERYNQALQLSPSLGVVYCNRGQVHAALGDTAQALADYEQAIQMSVEPSEAYLGRGSIYYQQGGYEQALADCDRAIAAAPEGCFSRDERWLDHFIKANAEWAIVCCTRLLQRYPDQADWYWRRGEAYLAGGAAADALPDFEQAIALAPDDVRAYLGRGQVYMIRGETGPAEADFRYALAHATRNDLRRQAEALLRDLHGMEQAILLNLAVPKEEQRLDLEPEMAITLADDGAAGAV
ncbi:MAG: tetratricopeptide repeat protein [Chloroflexaceae bacterium]